MSTASPNFDPANLARQLSAADLGGTIVAAEGLVVPPTFDDAIAVQMASLEMQDLTETTWKVAVTPEGEGVRAPMFPLIAADDVAAAFRYDSSMRIEVEIAVRLAKALPVQPETPYTRENIRTAVSEVILGVEVLQNRLPAEPAYFLRLADRMGNAGYAIGPSLPAELIDTVNGMPLKVSIAGTSIFDAPAAHPKLDVLAWLLAYANNAARPADSLIAGELVTTGSLCGAVALPVSGEMRCVLNDEWTMSVKFA